MCSHAYLTFLRVNMVHSMNESEGNKLQVALARPEHTSNAIGTGRIDIDPTESMNNLGDLA